MALMKLATLAAVLLTPIMTSWAMSDNKSPTDRSVTPGSGKLTAEKSPASDRAQPLTWKTLAPAGGQPFNDPFQKLTDDQMADLSYVVQVRQMIAEEKISADGRDASESEELATKLEQQGIDIDWLMVQRDRIRRLRATQVDQIAKSIARSLQDVSVSLVGYVIPVKHVEGRLTEFYLVPTMAACSHENPPPRLQTVFVSLKNGIKDPGRQKAIRVTGKVKAEKTQRSTVNGNGVVIVHSAYAIQRPTAGLFQPIDQPNTADKAVLQNN